MKTIMTKWFTNSKGTVGIVFTEDPITKKREAYISAVDGNDEETDIKFIKEWGNTFPTWILNNESN